MCKNHMIQNIRKAQSNRKHLSSRQQQSLHLDFLIHTGAHHLSSYDFTKKSYLPFDTNWVICTVTLEFTNDLW